MGVNVPAECSFIPTLTQEQESGGDRDCTQPTLLEIPTHRYDLRHQPKGGLPWPWKISPTISSSAGSKGSGLSPAPSLTCPRLWIHLSGAPSSSPTRRKGSSLDRRSVALRVPTEDTAELGRSLAPESLRCGPRHRPAPTRLRSLSGSDQGEQVAGLEAKPQRPGPASQGPPDVPAEAGRRATRESVPPRGRR